MNAKEMFAELGYKRLEPVSQNAIWYQTIIGKRIAFNIEKKELSTMVTLDEKLISAVHQQMKELGWLDETV